MSNGAPDGSPPPPPPLAPRAAEDGPHFLSMIGLVAVIVAVVILVFFAIGYVFGRLFL